jgi:hypothetical protein
MLQCSNSCLKKKTFKAKHWWLMPVIPATREAEIGRMAVPDQPRKDKFSRSHLTQKAGHSGAPVNPATWRNINRRINGPGPP